MKNIARFSCIAAMFVLLSTTDGHAITQARIGQINQLTADIASGKINHTQAQQRAAQLKRGLSSRDLNSQSVKKMNVAVTISGYLDNTDTIPKDFKLTEAAKNVGFTRSELQTFKTKLENIATVQDTNQPLSTNEGPGSLDGDQGGADQQVLIEEINDDDQSSSDQPPINMLDIDTNIQQPQINDPNDQPLPQNLDEGDRSDSNKEIITVDTKEKQDAANTFANITNQKVDTSTTNDDMLEAIKNFTNNNLKKLQESVSANSTEESLAVKYNLDKLKEAAATLTEKSASTIKDQTELLLLTGADQDSEKTDGQIIETIKEKLQKVPSSEFVSAENINEAWGLAETINNNDKKETQKQTIKKAQLESIQTIGQPLNLAVQDLKTIIRSKDKNINEANINEIKYENIEAMIQYASDINNEKETLMKEVQQSISLVNGVVAEAKQKLLKQALGDPKKETATKNSNEWKAIVTLDKNYTNAITQNKVLKAKYDAIQTELKKRNADELNQFQTLIKNATESNTIDAFIGDYKKAYQDQLEIDLANLEKEKIPEKYDNSAYEQLFIPFYNSITEIVSATSDNAQKEEAEYTRQFFVDSFKDYIVKFIVQMRRLTGLEELPNAMQGNNENARKVVQKILPQSANNLSKMVAALKETHIWTDGSWNDRNSMNLLDQHIEFELARNFAYICAAFDSLEQRLYTLTEKEKIEEWIKYLITGGPLTNWGSNLSNYKWYYNSIVGIQTPLQNIIKIYMNILPTHLPKNNVIVTAYNSSLFNPIESYTFKTNEKDTFLPEKFINKDDNNKYIYKQDAAIINTGIFNNQSLATPNINGNHKKNYFDIIDQFEAKIRMAWNITEDRKVKADPNFFTNWKEIEWSKPQE